MTQLTAHGEHQRGKRRDRQSLGRRWLTAGLVVAAFMLLAGAGAAAALESDTVDSYWRGLWWATSLMTTVGFVGRPPATAAGAGLSAVLMVAGFLLLSLISATLASVFIRDSEKRFELEERAVDAEVLARLTQLAADLDRLGSMLESTHRHRADAPAPPEVTLGRWDGPRGASSPAARARAPRR